MDIKKICFNCMKDKIGEDGICTSCGFSNNSYQAEPDQLVPLTPLNGRYLIGRAIGAGGFGITYIALDIQLQVVVAIKELYLKSISIRNQTKIISAQPKDEQCFEENKKLFLDEARTLARVNKEDNEGIVIVREHFEENNTAYIVTEYLTGKTLRQRIKEEKMTYEAMKDLMAPICHALMKVHQFGVIHMDVSPDNIMILEEGGAKLLDFGGAKSVFTNEMNNFISIKRGYAPPEQYMANGKTGQWTDVYATAATMYYCLTGVKPTDAMERRSGKDILKPSQMGVKIPVRAEEALMKALELDPGQRYQSIEEFWNAINVKGKRNMLALGIAGGVAAIGLIIVLFINSGILVTMGKSLKTAATSAEAEKDANTQKADADNTEDAIEDSEALAEEEKGYEIGQTMSIAEGSYIFENKGDDNFVMGVDSGFGDDGAMLKLKAYSDRNCNRLAVTHDSDTKGFYNLSAMHTNSFIETSADQEAGTGVGQYQKSADDDKSTWSFVYCGREDDKDIVIIKNEAGLVLAPTDGKLEGGADIVLTKENLEDETQKWYMRWSERDEAEETVVVYREGNLVGNKMGINTIASALDGTTMFSISRDESLFEPTMIVWTEVWDKTQQFEFVLTEESRYRIYPVDQLKGERKCLEYNETDDKIVLRDESDNTNQLFRIVYAGFNMYLIQSYNESVLGFDVNEDGSTDGNAIFARPYDAVADSRLAKWLMQPAE